MPPSPEEIAQREEKERRRQQQKARREKARQALDLMANAPPWLKNLEAQVEANGGEVPAALIEITKCVVCDKPAIPGGNRCGRHPGSVKTVKKNANRRIRGLVEETVTQLAEAMRQNKHLPSKLTAIKTILERADDNALGPTKTMVTPPDTRPIIKIGIAVGGVRQVNQPALPEAMIRAEVNGEAVDAEVMEASADPSRDS